MRLLLCSKRIGKLQQLVYSSQHAAIDTAPNNKLRLINTILTQLVCICFWPNLLFTWHWHYRKRYRFTAWSHALFVAKAWQV